MDIKKSKLADATIEITINNDLSSHWVLTEKDDSSKKWFTTFVTHNPYNMQPWEDEAEVRSMEANVRLDPTAWSPVLTAAEQKAENTPYEEVDVRYKKTIGKFNTTDSWGKITLKWAKKG